MSENEAARLNQQFAQRTGLNLGLLQRPGLAGFVKRRCQELGLVDEVAYHHLMMTDARETERLVKEVSVPETWFFRYPASFELLMDRCRAILRVRGVNDKLSMLSIACATGEEPYGMTMAAVEAGWALDRIAVTAIDRDEESLAVARVACYGDNSFREQIPPWAKQWFRQTNEGACVDAKIVSRVDFLCQDILNTTPTAGTGTYDFVFCRNLFIYLGDQARTKLVDLLLSRLSPNGTLFVGHAESPILPSDFFESAQAKQAFALSRKRSLPNTHNASTGLHKPNLRPAARQARTHVIAPVLNPVLPLTAAPDTQRIATIDDARALADTGQVNEALAILANLQSLTSARAEFFELLGSIKLGAGQLQEARDAFNKVLYFDPDHEAALLHMAIICDRLGNKEQASRFRRRAVRAHDDQQREASKENA